MMTGVSTGSPPAIAAALRSVARVLLVRLGLAVVAGIFFATALATGRGWFATGVAIGAGLAGASVSVYLLMALLRVWRALRDHRALLAALLVTSSIVVAAIQGYVAYQQWTIGESAGGHAWLGSATVFGPVAFLVGMLALVSAIVAAVERHRPDVDDLDADGAICAAIVGLAFTFVLHLPFARHVSPTTTEPGLAAVIVLAHIVLQALFVPLLHRAASRLEERGALAEARVAPRA
jgi:hypothetical protein